MYYRPDGKRISLGTSKKAAVTAANRANQILAPEGEGLVNKILGHSDDTFGAICDRFDSEYLDTRNYAVSTLVDYKHKLSVIKKRWGGLYPKNLSVLIVSAFVDGFPPRQSERYAGFLRQFFKFARAKGYFETNLAADLITEPVEIKRQRLSLDAYQTIYKVAEPWLQHAMNLALQSLQRREDLVLLKFEDYRDGILPVHQLKTESNVRIAVGPELDKAIRECRDDVVSTFMVHKKPTRITQAGRARREHHTQVLPEQLTRAFADTRDAAGLFSGGEKGTAPTFHEIRGLGAKLYAEAGFNPQSLLGHKDEASTKIYLDRHEIEWIEAAGGLKI